MATQENGNEDIKRAAADASALIGARKAQQSRPSGFDDGRVARPAAQESVSRTRSDASARANASARTKTGANARHGAHGKVSSPARERSRASTRAQKQTLFEFSAQNAVYIVAVAAIVAIFVIVLGAVKSCVPALTNDYDGELDFYYESPFDWNNLQIENGRAAYVDQGKVRSKLGIDVSESQQEIDWNAVAADGIDFAMIRLGYRGATEGDLFTDEQFAANLEQAQAAGVDCGVYFFSQATSKKEAIAEADFIIQQLDGAQLQYPVALDFEEAVAGVDAPRGAYQGKDAMTDILNAFCKRIEKAGYRSMVYGNYYDLDLYHYNALKERAVWWAEYDVSLPSPNVDIVMWQYSNNGWVDGIQTVVDMNIDLSDALD